MVNILNELKFFRLTFHGIKVVKLVYREEMNDVLYEKTLALIRALQMFYDKEYWDSQIFDPAGKQLTNYTIDMFHKGVSKARYILDNTQEEQTAYSGNLIAELECIRLPSIYNRMIFSFRLLNDSDSNLKPKMYIKEFIISKMLIHKTSVELYCVQKASESAEFFLNDEPCLKKDYINNFESYRDEYGLKGFVDVMDIRGLKHSNYEYGGDKVV